MPRPLWPKRFIKINGLGTLRIVKVSLVPVPIGGVEVLPLLIFMAIKGPPRHGITMRCTLALGKEGNSRRIFFAVPVASLVLLSYVRISTAERDGAGSGRHAIIRAYIRPVCQKGLY